MKSNPYKHCLLCAHRCGADRTAERGVCGMSDSVTAARAALHFWEEPPISGTRGSGAIFFSGCSLGCCYCQNRSISGGDGIPITLDRLAEIMLDLQSQGAHNINLVTATHYAPSVREAVISAREKGLTLPIVYNTASYDSPDALSLLDGIVDVYLPDLKYYRSETAKKLSRAPNYPTVAKQAIAEMYRQVGSPIIEDGIIRRGVVVRILLLPSHLAEAKLNLKYLYSEYGDGIYISLMNQYTPMSGVIPPLDRRVTRAEYGELVDYALRLGVKNCFIQEEGTAEESFIPPFDRTGIIK